MKEIKLKDWVEHRELIPIREFNKGKEYRRYQCYLTQTVVITEDDYTKREVTSRSGYYDIREPVGTYVMEDHLKSVQGSREFPYNGIEQECREEIYKRYYKEWAAQEYYYLVHRVQYFNPSQSVFIQPTYQFNDIGKVEMGFW